MKRLLQTILAALGLCAGCSDWTVVSPRRFTEDFADELRKSSPGIKVELINDLEVKVTATNGRSYGSFLNNAYAMYKRDPKSKAEVIQTFIAAGLETAAGFPEGVDRTRIVPIIKEKLWLRETRKVMAGRGDKGIEDRVFEDLNSDLLIVYAQDSPKNIRYLTTPDLDKAGITREELRAIASENLKTLLPNIERRGGKGLYMVTAGGTYEASLLTVDSLWTDGKMRVKGDFVVAVPTRDLLLVTGTQEPEGIRDITRLANEAFYKASSYRLTPKLFVHRQGKFEPLEGNVK